VTKTLCPQGREGSKEVLSHCRTCSVAPSSPRVFARCSEVRVASSGFYPLRCFSPDPSVSVLRALWPADWYIGELRAVNEAIFFPARSISTRSNRAFSGTFFPTFSPGSIGSPSFFSRPTKFLPFEILTKHPLFVSLPAPLLGVI